MHKKRLEQVSPVLESPRSSQTGESYGINLLKKQVVSKIQRSVYRKNPSSIFWIFIKLAWTYIVIFLKYLTKVFSVRKSNHVSNLRYCIFTLFQ